MRLHCFAQTKAVPITYLDHNAALTSSLLEAERSILSRIAVGGPLDAVLNDIVPLIESPSKGEMLASILFLSEDGKHLRQGAAPSLPDAYNKAIDGIEIGMGVGSCGTAAFTGQPVFVSDIAHDPLWKDFRDLALAHGLRACWSVPIRSADGRILGTFANYYREPKEPTERDTEVISMMAQTTALAIERHRRDLERQRAEEQRVLLLRELNHRVKNLFALVNSLMVMSARSAATPQDLSKAMQGRLLALSRAHELVQPGLRDPGEGIEETYAVQFRDVLNDILEPYALSGSEARVRCEGPGVTVTADAITSLALVLNELATNAAKYGALSVAGGCVQVTWRIDNSNLEISWREEGGPAIASPSRTGFGTTLTRRSVEHQLRGAIVYDWAQSGLRVSIRLPLSAIAP